MIKDKSLREYMQSLAEPSYMLQCQHCKKEIKSICPFYKLNKNIKQTIRKNIKAGMAHNYFTNIMTWKEICISSKMLYLYKQVKNTKETFVK